LSQLWRQTILPFEKNRPQRLDSSPCAVSKALSLRGLRRTVLSHQFPPSRGTPASPYLNPKPALRDSGGKSPTLFRKVVTGAINRLAGLCSARTASRAIHHRNRPSAFGRKVHPSASSPWIKPATSFSVPLARQATNGRIESRSSRGGTASQKSRPELPSLQSLFVLIDGFVH
jgi:hypothetical protein